MVQQHLTLWQSDKRQIVKHNRPHYEPCHLASVLRFYYRLNRQRWWRVQVDRLMCKGIRGRHCSTSVRINSLITRIAMANVAPRIGFRWVSIVTRVHDSSCSGSTIETLTARATPILKSLSIFGWRRSCCPIRNQDNFAIRSYDVIRCRLLFSSRPHLYAAEGGEANRCRAGRAQISRGVGILSRTVRRVPAY